MLSSFLPLVLCVMSVRQVLVRCFISLLASYPRVNAVYFCHQTFNAHAFSMQRCTGCQGDADLGTNLQSVLWFLNHKHGMLGMELSNSVLQTSISILSARCSRMHLTAFANNMEVGCTLSKGCDSLSYFI